MLSLRRDDVTTTRTVVRITNFNPRLREGGDDIYHAPSCCKKISIHASAKEATRPRIGFEKLSAISIHASAKEATSWPLLLRWYSLFQSTPPRRRRQFLHYSIRQGGDFNPRLREGGDTRWMATQPTVQISIHASAKEATQ